MPYTPTNILMTEELMRMEYKTPHNSEFENCVIQNELYDEEIDENMKVTVTEEDKNNFAY